ncbi:hypothetical protein HKX48_005934 [Thoreauomyces humboldtii]|nr:hypothetical protein HKX48_005934 [Thoreauomyces humboldtii]
MSSDHSQLQQQPIDFLDALPDWMHPDFLPPSALAFLLVAFAVLTISGNPARQFWTLSGVHTTYRSTPNKRPSGFSFFLSKARRQKSNTVLLTGLAESGKTVLFMKLRYGSRVPTHVSLEENDAKFPFVPSPADTTSKRVFPTLHLIDLPGHEKLRFKYTEHIATTGAIVFVVDSTTIARELRPAAEYLYDLLSNRYAQRNEIPVLIFCNKAELLMALGVDKIKALLEGEMDKLRTTRAAELQSLDDEKDHGSGHHHEEYLGVEGQPFAFDQLVNDVRFAPGSVIAEGEDHWKGPPAVVKFISDAIQ